jgi:UDP-hydrolysing UDP-N-acetyl-D-glucosamine 2-epimerase
VKSKRRIAVVLVDRANYGRLYPVMKKIQEHESLELLTIVSGSMLLEKFGLPVRVVRQDGFNVDAEVHIEMEGSYPVTMAKSIGIAVMEFATILNSLKPDLLLVIGDRYEALGATLSAAYQNIPIAHIQGGEISGSIDESARHAISKFAHFHFVSTTRSADYLTRMGEQRETIFLTGCPSGDVIKMMDKTLSSDVFQAGVGSEVNPKKPYLLVILHPVTTEYGSEEDQAQILLDALDEIAYPTIWLWPNIDAGSDHISKILRRFRKFHENHWLRLIKGFPPPIFEGVLYNAKLAIGNSSSFVRDASFLGTPVVLVGDRQHGREMAENVICVDFAKEAVLEACHTQLANGRYPASTLYGKGDAASKIVEKLAEIDLYLQKRLCYWEDEIKRQSTGSDSINGSSEN